LTSQKNEAPLRQSLLISGADPTIFVSRPASGTLQKDEAGFMSRLWKAKTVAEVWAVYAGDVDAEK